MMFVYLFSLIANWLLSFCPHYIVQALRWWSIWKSIRGSVQLRRQSLCRGWNRGHSFCLCAACSAVSYEKHVIHWQMMKTLSKYWLFPAFFPCCTSSDGWTGFRLQRLYFVWVCRELQSFYWFAELLCALHHKVRANCYIQYVILI